MKSPTQIYLLGFINDLPIAYEYKIALNKLYNHHEKSENGIIFNYNLEHPLNLNLKGNILMHYYEVLGPLNPNFDDLEVDDAVLLIKTIYDDLINDPDFRYIGGELKYYAFYSK
jgi:hypothetical protein